MRQAQSLALLKPAAEFPVILIKMEEGMKIPVHVLFNGITHQAASCHFVHCLRLLQDFICSSFCFSAQLIPDSGILQLSCGFLQFIGNPGQFLPDFNGVAFQHQGMTQAVAHGEKHSMMLPAEAPVIYLYTHVWFHNRRAQITICFPQLRLALQGTEKALTVQFHGIPYRNCVDMISHLLSNLFL